MPSSADDPHSMYCYSEYQTSASPYHIMPYLYSLLIRLLGLAHFQYRSLTAGEILMCQQVFANKIQYQQVKVMNHPYLPWQAYNIVMAPCGYIHARPSLYRDDYSAAPLGFQALFIHEMTHIYQYQNNINVLFKGAILQMAYFCSFRTYNPYRYQLKKGKAFASYNIEQQGDIARDIYLKKIPNIILNSEM